MNHLNSSPEEGAQNAEKQINLLDTDLNNFIDKLRMTCFNFTISTQTFKAAGVQG